MTLCSFPMDLSSLEGPPIHDPSLTMSIPQIQLDHALFATPYPESLAMPMPDPDFEFQHRLRASYPSQRPISADILPHQKHTPQRRQRNQPSLTLDTNTTHHSYTPAPINRHSYTPSTSYSNTRAPNQYHHHHNPSTHRQTHAPRRLTWVESESIWKIISTEASPTSPSSTWGDVNWAATRSRPPVLTHSRSMDLSLAQTQAQRSMQRYSSAPRVSRPQAEEVPPPYERHYFDRPLGGHLLDVEGGGSILESASFDPPGSLNVDGDTGVGVGLTGERRNRDGVAGWPRPSSVEESRWTEIGRRMNRSLGG